MRVGPSPQFEGAPSKWRIAQRPEHRVGSKLREPPRNVLFLFLAGLSFVVFHAQISCALGVREDRLCFSSNEHRPPNGVLAPSESPCPFFFFGGGAGHQKHHWKIHPSDYFEAPKSTSIPPPQPLFVGSRTKRILVSLEPLGRAARVSLWTLQRSSRDSPFCF